MHVSPPVIRLKPGEDARVRAGHPWVFASSVGCVEQSSGLGAPGSGALVRVVASGGSPVGEGFYSPSSRVRVRMIREGSGAPLEDDDDLIRLVEDRLRMSLSARRGFMDDGAGRLVFGEADGLPGLVVDRYGNALVAQLLSAGMDRIRPMLIARLSALCAPDLIVERSDTGSREQEGLPAVRGVLAGRLPDDGLVRFTAGGMSLVADVLEGQKTGFYLDQKDNWAALRPFGKGRRILDVCCYTGAFGLSLMLGGGVSLVGVDSSRRALDLAVEHARLNGMDGRSAFVAGDAGAILAGLAASGERYDFVIVDPSALARTKKHRTLALRAYRALNSAALKATAPGGLLFSCSCTPWVGALELAGIVAGLAREAGRCARLLEVRGQSRDHVAHPLMPETRYLTGTLWHIG